MTAVTCVLLYPVNPELSNRDRVWSQAFVQFVFGQNCVKRRLLPREVLESALDDRVVGHRSFEVGITISVEP